MCLWTNQKLKNKTVKLEGILSFSLSINKIKQQLTKKHLCCENKERQKTPSVWFFNSNNLLRKQITFIIRQKECKKSFLDHNNKYKPKKCTVCLSKNALGIFFSPIFPTPRSYSVLFISLRHYRENYNLQLLGETVRQNL